MCHLQVPGVSLCPQALLACLRLFAGLPGRVLNMTQAVLLVLLVFCMSEADLQKVAITQSVIGDTKTPQVSAGDTFWLAGIDFLGLVTFEFLLVFESMVLL